MSNQISDTKYLYASSRVRALENSLLTRERLGRMIDARSDAEALKVLAECGYTGVPDERGGELESCLASMRRSVYGLLSQISPDQNLIDTLRIRYDYHNLKVLIKSAAAGSLPDAGRLLIDCGRVPADVLIDMFSRLAFSELPPAMRDCADYARDVLARTSDAQLSDFVLDRACMREMTDTARLSGSEFLAAYVRLYIDASNLRGYVRAVRTGRADAVLHDALNPGGNIGSEKLISAFGAATPIAGLYAMSPLSDSAAEGEALARAPGALTPFEKRVDGVLTAYLKSARYIPFGEQPLIAYLAAREAEFISVRTVMAGRYAKLEPEQIRERLRDPHV